MTGSFAKGETGRAYVGRIAGAAREGRRCPVSNFSFCAVAISDPKACSVGLAVSPHIRREATPIQFVVAPNGGNGPMSAFSTQKYRHRPAPIPTSNPAARVAASLLGWDRGCVFSPGRSRGFQISLRSELAGHPAQDVTESFGSVAPSIIGFGHGSHHEGSHVREVVKSCRG